MVCKQGRHYGIYIGRDIRVHKKALESRVVLGYFAIKKYQIYCVYYVVDCTKERSWR